MYRVLIQRDCVTEMCWRKCSKYPNTRKWMMEIGEISMELFTMSEMFFCLENSCQWGEHLSMRNSYFLHTDKLDFRFPRSCDPVHVKNLRFL